MFDSQLERFCEVKNGYFNWNNQVEPDLGILNIQERSLWIFVVVDSQIENELAKFGGKGYQNIVPFLEAWFLLLSTHWTFLIKRNWKW